MYKAMMDNMFDRLDVFAGEMALYEPEPVLVTPPLRPGFVPAPVTVTAVYIPNPSQYLIKSVGVEANLNGFLFIRTRHIPLNPDLTPKLDFTPGGDGVAENGWHVQLRGRSFGVTKITTDRREVALILSDRSSLVRSQ